MRQYKNNISPNVRNITLNLKNITPHFTEKEKIITLVSIILMLSSVNITLCFLNASNTLALSCQGSAEIKFTFSPTLSVNISPSNLVIDNLTPGTTGDSNTINVSVATNAAYGYTLSAIMNGNNSNLTHTNGANVFSSIATDASLPSLTTNNTWGYSYKNNLVFTPTWSSYSGLSNLVDKVLFNTDSNSSGSIDFKIIAKASETQPSGTYTGTINFTATTKPMPKTIDDIAYMQTFAELDTVDLASVKSSMALNSAYTLKDVRDEKEYYVTRLEDGNVWMTQNLDLNLDSNRTYTHYDTDLGWGDPNNLDINATWQPGNSTIEFIGTNVPNWQNSYSASYSASPGNSYHCPPNLAENNNHCHIGNYYNWISATAGGNAQASICPSGWRLPAVVDTESEETEYGILLKTQGIISLDNVDTYLDKGYEKLINTPAYFVPAGLVSFGDIRDGNNGYYWYNTPSQSSYAYRFYFNSSKPKLMDSYVISTGASIRCLAR